MKMTMLAALVLVSGVANADHVKPQVVITEAADVALSSDEQAFVAKLDAHNRKAFMAFSAEQKKAAMIAVAQGAQADEAVQHLVTAQALKTAVVDATEVTAEESTK